MTLWTLRSSQTRSLPPTRLLPPFPGVSAHFLHPHSINNRHLTWRRRLGLVQPFWTPSSSLTHHLPLTTVLPTSAHTFYTPIALIIAIHAWRHQLGLVQPFWTPSSSLTRHLPSTTYYYTPYLCRRHQGGGSQGCQSPSSNMAVDDLFERLMYSKWGNKSNEGKMRMRSGNRASKVW
jgi:hypothetical protein